MLRRHLRNLLKNATPRGTALRSYRATANLAALPIARE